MKKLICMLTVLLCSVMSLSAQDINLEGRWVAEESEGDNQGSLIFLFEDNELTQAVYAEANTPEVGVVGVMVATPPAPFKLEGNKPLFQFNSFIMQPYYQILTRSSGAR